LPQHFFETWGLQNDNHRIHESATAGLWENWLYFNDIAKVPLTFEVYRNGSSTSAEMAKTIEENTTHRIEEWFGIFEYFNPEPEFIDALWLELRPAFDYLLKFSPRIIANDFSYSLGDSKIDFSLSITNKGERVSSLETVNLYDEVVLCDEEIGIEELAQMSGRLHYEFLTGINPLIKRIIVISMINY